ncbi:UDP-N-acetylglucosamine 1-carboxyvinyltransferase [Candidatus Roizmanbacteria bacterium]|nr:UDP-N-acetylglucosamine 1-carboxyvinyltransferase [Candidatus Roizmanbacteria bacterium]
MSKFIITGGKPLAGNISVSGNKNAVLPIMAATLLVKGKTHLTNVPRIHDVAAMAAILTDLGATVEGVGSSSLTISTDAISSHRVRPDLAKKLRASVLLLGPLFARFGEVDLPHPGGDIIGQRSINTHLVALELLGASITQTHDHYHVQRSARKIGDEIKVFLDEPSVTGTENIIMASVLGGKTVHLENAACEPHIVDLSQFLNACGASIHEMGTHKISISGVNELSGTSYEIQPDYIEAGTFAVLSSVTGGRIRINGVRAEDIQQPLHVLEEMRVSHRIEHNTLTLSVQNLTASRKRIQSAPHPGFPTDLMSPFIVLGTQAQGETLFHDPLYESRMFFVDKLRRMGAQITICDPHRVIVYGPAKLHGSYQASPDIRAGIALVIAALIAEGESTIDHTEIIERGYEQLVERLSSLGADIRKDG